MKIILLQDIKNLGKKHDVKTVRDGYARNFLFAKKLAKPATEKDVKEVQIKKRKLAEKEAEAVKRLNEFSRRLSGESFSFAVKTGDKGEIFESVGKGDIEKAVADFAIGIEPVSKDDLKADLSRPLKTLGEHRVKISLGKGVTNEVKVTLYSQP